MVDHAQRQGALHGYRLAIEIGREMAGIGEGDGAIVRDFERETCGLGVAAAEQALVEHMQNRFRIGAGIGGGADGTDQQGDEHSSLEAFAGYIARDDEEAAIGFVGNDLEEVAADFLRGVVNGFDFEAGNGLDVVRENDLLDFAGCGYFALENSLLAAHAGGAQHHDDGQREVEAEGAEIAQPNGEDAEGKCTECLSSLDGGEAQRRDEGEEPGADLGVDGEGVKDEGDEENGRLAVAAPHLPEKEDGNHGGKDNSNGNGEESIVRGGENAVLIAHITHGGDDEGDVAAEPEEPAEWLTQKGLNHEQDGGIGSVEDQLIRKKPGHRDVAKERKEEQGQRGGVEDAEDEDPEIFHALTLAEEEGERDEADAEGKEVFNGGGGELADDAELVLLAEGVLVTEREHGGVEAGQRAGPLGERRADSNGDDEGAAVELRIRDGGDETGGLEIRDVGVDLSGLDERLAVDIDLEGAGDEEGLQSELVVFGVDFDVEATPDNGRLGVGEILDEPGFGIHWKPRGVVEIGLGPGGIVASLHHACQADLDG